MSTNDVRVSALFIHPIKSAAGIAVQSLQLDDWGAVDDRRWMLVDSNGKFLTQREVGGLALIHPVVSVSGLLLQSESHSPITVEYPSPSLSEHDAVVWGDDVKVRDAGDAAAAWCTEVTGLSCRLVHIANSSCRPLHPKYAGSVESVGRTVALSDGAPLLVLGEGSMRELNRRLRSKQLTPLGADRFRPNVLLSGTEAHDEDSWLIITVGNVTLGIGSPCPRCVITTIDQQVGSRASIRHGEAGGEPLRTLAAYRRQGSGVMFGMNATHAHAGTLHVGDAVTVVERRP